MNRDISQKKCFFQSNQSWNSNFDGLLVSIISDQNLEGCKIMINGVANVGKSIFASCLINMILTSCDLDVYIMDLDPGQPNY